MARDAAATLLALNEIWQLGLDLDTLAELGLKLGADIPMCLHGAAIGTPLVARGIGEQLTHVKQMPALPLLLVNDGTAVATPDVFQALTKRDNPSLPSPSESDIETICTYLGSTRNDLLPAALTLAPQIDNKLDLLRMQGALLRRCQARVRPALPSSMTSRVRTMRLLKFGRNSLTGLWFPPKQRHLHSDVRWPFSTPYCSHILE